MFCEKKISLKQLAFEFELNVSTVKYSMVRQYHLLNITEIESIPVANLGHIKIGYKQYPDKYNKFLRLNEIFTKKMLSQKKKELEIARLKVKRILLEIHELKL